MDRAAVAKLPRWERDLLERSGVAMLGMTPLNDEGDVTAATLAPPREMSEYDVLTKSGAELGLA